MKDLAKDKRSFQKISIIKLIFKVTIWITKRLLHYSATRHSLLEPIVHDTKLSNWYIGTYICNWRHKNTLLHPCFTEHPGISEWGIRVNPKFALGFDSFFSVIFHPWLIVKVSIVSRYVSGCLFIPENRIIYCTIFDLINLQLPGLCHLSWPEHVQTLVDSSPGQDSSVYCSDLPAQQTSDSDHSLYLLLLIKNSKMFVKLNKDF